MSSEQLPDVAKLTDEELLDVTVSEHITEVDRPWEVLRACSDAASEKAYRAGRESMKAALLTSETPATPDHTEPAPE